MREVEARKQRQQALSRAADDVKAVVFDMVYPWKVRPSHSTFVPIALQEKGYNSLGCRSMQRLDVALFAITSGLKEASDSEAQSHLQSMVPSD